jgi:hypothetical protein
MKPTTRLIINAVVLVLAIILALILFGALLNLVRCVIVAAVVALVGAFLYRALTQRDTPPSKQIIDQPPADSQSDATGIAQQIEARKERLG